LLFFSSLFLYSSSYIPYTVETIDKSCVVWIFLLINKLMCVSAIFDLFFFSLVVVENSEIRRRQSIIIRLENFVNIIFPFSASLFSVVDKIQHRW
jgi:hypothetical protein